MVASACSRSCSSRLRSVMSTKASSTPPGSPAGPVKALMLTRAQTCPPSFRLNSSCRPGPLALSASAEARTTSEKGWALVKSLNGRPSRAPVSTGIGLLKLPSAGFVGVRNGDRAQAWRAIAAVERHGGHVGVGDPAHLLGRRGDHALDRRGGMNPVGRLSEHDQLPDDIQHGLAGSGEDSRPLKGSRDRVTTGALYQSVNGGCGFCVSPPAATRTTP